MLPAFGLSMNFSLLMCVHVLRSGNELYWLFSILARLRPAGGGLPALEVLSHRGLTAAKLMATMSRNRSR